MENLIYFVFYVGAFYVSYILSSKESPPITWMIVAGGFTCLILNAVNFLYLHG